MGIFFDRTGVLKMPGKKVAQAPAVATKGTAKAASSKSAGKGKKAAPKKAAKKEKKTRAKPEVHDYARVNRKKAAVIKAQQTKQRALQVAKVIAQGKQKKGQARVRTSLHFHRPRTLRLARKPKFPASYSLGKPSSAKSYYNIVKYPLQTESAMNKIEEQNTIVFIVDPKANKHQIKKAVESLYQFKTANINTLIRPDGLKKAFVRLTPDFEALEEANKMGFV